VGSAVRSPAGVGAEYRIWYILALKYDMLWHQYYNTNATRMNTDLLKFVKQPDDKIGIIIAGAKRHFRPRGFSIAEYRSRCPAVPTPLIIIVIQF